jgi:hypothetical protein
MRKSMRYITLPLVLSPIDPSVFRTYLRRARIFILKKEDYALDSRVSTGLAVLAGSGK